MAIERKEFFRCPLAGARDKDRHLLLNAPGACRHYDDPVSQDYRLGDAVSDEHAGPSLRLPDFQEFVLHLFPGLFVQGAKRFVQKQYVGLVCQGPRDSHPLLHPARQLIGVVTLEPGQVDQIDVALRYPLELVLWQPSELGAVLDVLLHGEPG